MHVIFLFPLHGALGNKCVKDLNDCSSELGVSTACCFHDFGQCTLLSMIIVFTCNPNEYVYSPYAGDFFFQFHFNASTQAKRASGRQSFTGLNFCLYMRASNINAVFSEWQHSLQIESSADVLFLYTECRPQKYPTCFTEDAIKDHHHHQEPKKVL